MERGGRERDIFGNSKLTVCNGAAGYVKGLVVGKRVSVGVRVRVGVGIRLMVRIEVGVWFVVGDRVGNRR